MLPISERDMEYAIVATRVNGLPFNRCQMVDDEMKRKLQEGSKLRVDRNTEFASLRSKIDA